MSTEEVNYSPTILQVRKLRHREQLAPYYAASSVLPEPGFIARSALLPLLEALNE